MLNSVMSNGGRSKCLSESNLVKTSNADTVSKDIITSFPGKTTKDLDLSQTQTSDYHLTRLLVLDLHGFMPLSIKGKTILTWSCLQITSYLSCGTRVLVLAQ